MKNHWGQHVSQADRLEQFKLVYDYIKFHIGLYLATPPIFAVIAESFSVKDYRMFQLGLFLMIGVYLISGISAGLFMGRYVNSPWQERFLSNLEKNTFAPSRRLMHHTLYWVGLALGLGGLTAALVENVFL